MQTFKIAFELVCVECCTHHHQLHVGPIRQNFLHQAKQNVRLQSALVRLIQNDATVKHQIKKKKKTKKFEMQTKNTIKINSKFQQRIKLKLFNEAQSQYLASQLKCPSIN
jgi:hypothetical protein